MPDESLRNGIIAFRSPVEERHIDFMLEEEFVVNPSFLQFFLSCAQHSAASKSRITACNDDHGCHAVRSATTADGESDLLVTYETKSAGRAAILIECQIRAAFQPSQPERYRARGRSGVAERQWSSYWTCLVAHSRYAVRSADFDCVVTLEDLHSFFAKEHDPRSQFRAKLIQSAVEKFERSGIKSVDQHMTRFRSEYAAMCDASLGSRMWKYETARNAWWDDSWFLIRRRDWPKGVKINHQARSGRMQLVFPMRNFALFDDILTAQGPLQRNGSTLIPSVAPVGRDKSAFQVHVPPVQHFDVEELQTLRAVFLEAVRSLTALYRAISDDLPAPLRIPS